MRTLLLPGMDGTGRLFEALRRHLPPAWEAEVVAYPGREVLGYQALLARLPLDGRPVRLVAESFSGPVGILAAASHPEVKALALVASFARFPAGPVVRALTALVPAAAFRRPPPPVAVRQILAGPDAPAGLVEAVREALAGLAPEVLVDRLRQVREVDVEGPLASLRIPVLALAGTRDRLVPLAALEALRRVRPSMEVAMLDAPHLLLQREPEQAARVLVEFLERVAPA